MSKIEPEGLAAEIRATAEFLGVVIRPEHLEEVVQNWRLLQAHRASLMSTLLPAELEPAPIFRP